MAICIFLEVSGSGPGTAVSATGKTVLPWSVGDATVSGGQYSCAVGSHLVMTIAEVNNLPKPGIPDAVLMREMFFMPFGLVLGCYVVGKLVGAVLHTIRKG